MASDEKWYFTKEQLETTPSRDNGIDAQKELIYRQQAAYFIQDMGQRLRVSQLCINTASVYMHRFYVFHSFTHFPWSSIAAAALFLAAKVEEQPRKLEHVIRVHNICKNPRDVAFDVNSERYQQQSQDLVFNENVLLQTLGFDVAIDHPHAHVVRCCHLVRASKDLAQTSYFMASTSLHLTTMCLQYKPTVVACFCIHLACKWSNWEIPLSNERREWFSYVDTTVTTELLAQLTDEFLAIFGRCPSRLKEKIMAIGDGANIANRNLGHPSSATSESDSRKQPPPTESKDSHHRPHHHEKSADEHKQHRQRVPHDAATAATTSSSSNSATASSGGSSSSSSSQQQREREYREKKERERLAHQHKLQQQHSSSSSNKLAAGPHGHHRPSSIDPKLKSSHSSRPSTALPIRAEHREVPREPSFRGDPNRDVTDNKDAQVRSDKDIIDKRSSYPIKPNSDTNNSSNIHAEHFSADKQRIDPSRSRPSSNDPKMMAYKHDSRRHALDEQKHMKPDNEARKHSSQQQPPPNWFEYNKNNLHSSKQPPMNNSTSQSKVKSPFAPELITQKSVPKSSSIKNEPHNGSNTSSTSNSNGNYNFAINDDVKPEPKEVPMKKPSMFSPEKTPPRKVNNSMKMPYDNMQQIQNQHIPNVKKPVNHGYDTSRPIKKMDQVEGFENILRDSSIGINSIIKSDLPDFNDLLPTTPTNIFGAPTMHMQQQPQSSQQPPQQLLQQQQQKEIKPLDMMLPSLSSASSTANNIALSQPIVNGIETNPTLISNLLKEAPSVPHLATISSGSVPDEMLATDDAKDHASKDKKKKNKEKHKHKDKDKSRDEKEKKRKHKDKDKEKHKSKNRDKEKVSQSGDEALAQPIKITISKDKIQPPEAAPSPSMGLKIKIPKDKIKTDIIEPPPPAQTPAIRIKISKEVINIGGGGNNDGTKKREREKANPGDVGPPHKASKYSRQQHVSGGEKQNGRNSFGKVGEDEAMSMHSNRYSDTSNKYTNKGTSGT